MECHDGAHGKPNVKKTERVNFGPWCAAGLDGGFKRSGH
jgi:hypothetical protein